MDYLSGVPEVDALLLDQMSDNDLVQYCQTSSTNRDLCEIGRIKKRILNYQNYLNFDHTTLFDYLPSRCMIYRHVVYEDQDIYRNEVDLFILDYNKSYSVSYLGSKDQFGQFSLIIEDYGWINRPLSIDRIIAMPYQGEAYYGVDVKTLYQIYNQLFGRIYAKEEVAINLQHLEKLTYQGTFQSFFNLMAYHLITKVQCIYLNLIDENVDNVDFTISPTYFDSEDGRKSAKNLIIDLLYYHDQLKSLY